MSAWPIMASVLAAYSDQLVERVSHTLGRHRDRSGVNTNKSKHMKHWWLGSSFSDMKTNLNWVELGKNYKWNKPCTEVVCL